MDMTLAILRWVHILAGITWIGLLYYLNLVQVAALRDAESDGTHLGIMKHVTPRVFGWIRWSALITWLMGAGILKENFTNAFLLKPGFAAIGMGAWVGTVMLLNVWLIIWPNHQKSMGWVHANEQEKSKAKRYAFLASRVNMMLSIPLIFLMANGLDHRAIIGL
jgi:uncharacterized membrane protein